MADNDYEYVMKSAQVFHPSFFQSKWRVKLYHLNGTGQWDDMGTGYVSIIKEVLINCLCLGRRVLYKNDVGNK
jgi:hypothetical protein